MLGRLWSYYRHDFDPGDFRVVMTLLVKNEADIVEANIRTHAALGVDAFVVMDHRSDDGTREILADLSGQYELHVIDQQETIYRQSEWMTRLARYARERLGADWVISNDADEFWLPRQGDNLKALLAFKQPYVSCRRFNMLLDGTALQPGYRFHDSRLRVDNPVFYGNRELTRDSVAIVLAKIAPKVIANPHGLLKIKGGNHRAKHAAKLLDYNKPYDRLKMFEDINVYHYSMRGYEQFARNVRHRRQMLEQDPNVRMGNHYRRWAELDRQGRLEQEYEKFILAEAELQVLRKFGVVTEDPFPGEMIRQALGDQPESKREIWGQAPRGCRSGRKLQIV